MSQSDAGSQQFSQGAIQMDPNQYNAASQGSLPQLAPNASYYLAPTYAASAGQPQSSYAASYGGLPAAAMYPQGGIWMGPSAYATPDQLQYAAAEAAAQQAMAAYSQPYMPMGASFYMPAGTGLPYMDPYGMMNPASMPPILPQSQPKKAPKKKPRNCC